MQPTMPFRYRPPVVLSIDGAPPEIFTNKPFRFVNYTETPNLPMYKPVSVFNCLNCPGDSTETPLPLSTTRDALCSFLNQKHRSLPFERNPINFSFFIPYSSNSMPQVVVQPGQVVSQDCFTGAEVVGQGEVTLVQSKRQEIVVRVPLFLPVGLPPAPQEKAAVAASPESHVYVHFVAYYPVNRKNHDRV